MVAAGQVGAVILHSSPEGRALYESLRSPPSG